MLTSQSPTVATVGLCCSIWVKAIYIRETTSIHPFIHSFTQRLCGIFQHQALYLVFGKEINMYNTCPQCFRKSNTHLVVLAHWGVSDTHPGYQCDGGSRESHIIWSMKGWEHCHLQDAWSPLVFRAMSFLSWRPLVPETSSILWISDRQSLGL